jgi:putative transposase
VFRSTSLAPSAASFHHPPPPPRRIAEQRLAEQHDDWIETCRYLGLDVLAKARLTDDADTEATTEEVTDTDLKALSA